MVFSSFNFIFIFLPIAFFGYFFINGLFGHKWSKYYLILSSLYFYSAWDFSLLPILISSIVINFALSIVINKLKRKELVLIAVAFNLLMLFYYKYANFVSVELGLDFSLQEVVLPLAISFFTFQQIAFIVDTYRYGTKYRFFDYVLFVVFFPQLIAGPIVHHMEMMPQFKYNKLDYSNIYKGVLLFSLGLFKKVVIADTLAVYANAGFSEPEKLLFWDAWGTSLAYTFQLYYDFSGYATMAIGLGLLFNIKLPSNFNSPYRAINIQDFWRRWHITLSKWLRDYVYIPLGGNRKGIPHTLINVFITAFVSGIWHGANWTFFVWGSLHGLAMVIHRIWSLIGFKLPILVSWCITFLFIVLTWVIFRSENLNDGFNIISSMLGFNRGFTPSNQWVDIINSTIGEFKAFSYSTHEFFHSNLIMLLIVILFIPMCKSKSTQTLVMEREFLFLIPCALMLFISVIFQFGYTDVESTFLYFNF